MVWYLVGEIVLVVVVTRMGTDSISASIDLVF